MGGLGGTPEVSLGQRPTAYWKSSFPSLQFHCYTLNLLRISLRSQRSRSSWRQRRVWLFCRDWLRELSKGRPFAHTAWDSLCCWNDFNRALTFLVSFPCVVVYDEAGTLLVEQLHRLRQSGRQSHRAGFEIPVSPVPSPRKDKVCDHVGGANRT